MFRAKYITALLCLALFATLRLQAQGSTAELSFRTINVDDGLSQNTVYAILQDRQNCLWFATKDGLNQYNGVQFRIFGSSNSGLHCDYTTCLYEDSTGLIWIGTDQGLYNYDPVYERITPCTQTAADGTAPTHRIRWIADDGEGHVCVSSEGQGLFRYVGSKPQLEALTTNVWTFLHDGKRLWLSLYEDDLYYQEKGKKRTPFALPDGSRPFRHAMIHALLQTPDGSLLVGSSEGLFRLSPDRQHVETLLDDCLVRTLLLRTEKELWVGAEDGLYIWNLQTSQHEHITASLTNPRFSLADNSIYAICRDREGGMWLGSYFGGINYLSPQSDLFRRYYPHDQLSHFGRHVREFCGDADGTLWIGTEDRGLFHFNPADGSIQALADPRLGTNIHGLCREGDTLWVGTFANGLGRLNLRTHQLERVYRKTDDPHSLNSDYVFSICHTHHGLYIGTISGLMRYRRDTDDFERIAKPYEFIYNMLEDSEGVLWLATYFGGVYSYDPYTKHWQNYRHEPDNPHSLPHNKVISIYEDSRHRLWFLTQGHGFCLFHRDTQRFDRYDPGTLIASNTAYRMLEGNDGQLWLSTPNGLLCFTPEEGFTKVYTTGNGLTTNQFNYQSGYRAADGTLYFGCTNGFVAFNPSTFNPQHTTCNLILSDFFLSGERVLPSEDSPLPRSINLLDEVTLSADQNSFSLHAALLSYKSPQAARITYRLDGLDPDSVWHEADPDGRILFAHLPTGHYTLHVRGTNSDGVPADSERTLSIYIRPPFYLSVWAWLLYLITAGLLLAIGMRLWRHRQQEQRRRTLEQLRRQKDQELLESKTEMIANYERLYDRFLQSPFAVVRDGSLTPTDQQFVDNLHQTVSLHLHDSEYGQERLSADMNMSRASLYRRLKSILGITPNEYIRTERLKRAAHLLRQGGLTVNEVCFRVGFNSPSYFTKCFHDQFGVLPKDF